MTSDDSDDAVFVPGPADDPAPEEPSVAGQPDPDTPAEAGDDELISDLDMTLELLQVFNVEYTLVQDESGATIEIAGGNRKTFGFQGVAVTLNFGPTERAEEFLFIGLSKL